MSNDYNEQDAIREELRQAILDRAAARNHIEWAVGDFFMVAMKEYEAAKMKVDAILAKAKACRGQVEEFLKEEPQDEQLSFL